MFENLGLLSEATVSNPHYEYGTFIMMFIQNSSKR
jgi:hypothetical protein